MIYQAFYSKNARKDLADLLPDVRIRILKKIDFYLQQKNPLTFAKLLKNIALGEYRFHVGDYRVIFDVDKQGDIYILMILRIRHRKDVYDL